MKKLMMFFTVMVMSGFALGQSTPFSAELKVINDETSPRIVLMVTVPANHKLYAESFEVLDATGEPLSEIIAPKPETVFDEFSDQDMAVFKHGFSAEYELPKTTTIDVTLFGCSDVACFPPTTLTLPVTKEIVAPVLAVATATDLKWMELADQFEVVDSEVGFMSVKAFVQFLDVKDDAGRWGFLKSPVEFFAQFGWPLTALLILLGGLALNLTPCVLPMIPVNVAIIGAGAHAGSKRKGFLLGGVYGLGIALTYGLIGLVVVLTGAKFGALNASPWFNAGIAVVFIVLGLAMFDVLMIDLSRFQNKIGTSKSGGSYALALSMGAVVALLAGACVAPVVIAVLLLSSNLYVSGAVMGLSLPFVLGIGMALPWPFVGAGLSFLPKPGNWMKYVKFVFGVLIIGMAIYYGHLSYSLFRSVEPEVSAEEAHGVSLTEGLQQALDEDRMVVVDFWATWCKNCMAMKKTTLKDVAVKEAMSEHVFVEYQAEDPNDEETAAVMDYFGARGLPTYIILKPKG